MSSQIKNGLNSLQGFSALSEPTVEQLLAFSSIRVVRAGETIFCQGEPSPFCFGILSGEIIIQHVARDNRFPPKVLSVLGPGSLFGESAIFEESPRAAMATASKDGQLVVLRGQALRAWLQRNPEQGQPLLLALLQSSLGRLHRTSHELAIVHGMGRLLGSDKPFLDQLAGAFEFLKGSWEGLDDVVLYRRSAYWEEFDPLMSLPTLSDLSAVPLGNEIIQKMVELGAAHSFDPKTYSASLAAFKLPWENRAAMAILPLFDWDKSRDPLQGLLVLASASHASAFAAEKQLLLSSVSLPLAEALSRYSRQEEASAQDRLQQSKKSLTR